MGVFVVSTGRCGSTLLSTMLRRHPGVLSLSEFFGLLMSGPLPTGQLSAEDYWQLLSTPHPFVTMAYRANVPIEEFLYRPSPAARFTADTGIPPLMVTPLPHLTDQPERLYDEIEAFVRAAAAGPAGAPEGAPVGVGAHHQRLFDWLATRDNASVWIERSGFSLRYLNELIELFPGARFVHLYRDGRECAYSMSRSNAFRLGDMWVKLHAALGVNPYLEDVPAGTQVPDDLVPLMPDNFDIKALDAIEFPAEDFGRTWSEQILAGLDLLEKLPAERVLAISYEQLTLETADTLEKLAEFAGPIPAPSEWIESARAMVSIRDPRWLGLPSEQRKKLEAECAPAMAALYP
jgi:Sulfotransferase family